MKNVKQIMNEKYSLIIFFLLSLIPFYWLRGHPVGWGDTGFFAFFYNSKDLFSIYNYTWISRFSTGLVSGQSMTLLPLSGLFSLLASFGLNNYTQQAFLYFLILFISMVFIYLFICELFDYRTDKKLIAIVSAIFYAFNPLVMINYWVQGMLSIYLIPFIPLALFLFLLILKRQKIIYLLLMALMFSLFSIVFLNSAFAISVIVILILIFIYQIVLNLRNKDKIKKMFIYTIVLIILSSCINAWFIIPFIPSVSDYYTVAITAMNPLQTLIGASQSVSLTTFFRLLPLRLDAGLWLYKDPTWRHYYNNPFFILLGSSVFLLILVPLISKRKDESILFFSLLLIFGLFLCLGLNSVFGFLFKQMYIHIPFFDIFRSPYSKFVPFLLVSCAVLFGVGMISLYNWIERKLKIQYTKLIIIIIIFLICGIYVFPMWTGSAVNTPITIRGNETSSFIEVPSYYQDIAKYFDNNLADYRILSLPLRPSGYVGFDWRYGYDGPDFTHILYKHTTISCMMDAIYYPYAKVLSSLKGQDLAINLYKITSLFGIKYIVLQNDVDIVHGNYLGKKLTSQQELKSDLTRLNVPFVFSFGKLDLYKISDDYFLPHIYASPS